MSYVESWENKDIFAIPVFFRSKNNEVFFRLLNFFFFNESSITAV